MSEAPRVFSLEARRGRGPNSKEPSDGDRLQSLSWEVDLSSVEQASLTGPDDLLCVGHGGGPLEALSEGVSY